MDTGSSRAEGRPFTGEYVTDTQRHTGHGGPEASLEAAQGPEELAQAPTLACYRGAAGTPGVHTPQHHLSCPGRLWGFQGQRGLRRLPRPTRLSSALTPALASSWLGWDPPVARCPYRGWVGAGLWGLVSTQIHSARLQRRDPGGHCGEA